MRVATVESTTLATVAYDETRKLLQLEFGSRAIYLYFGVPPEVPQALLGAPSKGRYFNQAIRGRFRYRLVHRLEAVLRDADALAGCDR